MDLVIDAGNTAIKLFVFEEKNLLKQCVLTYEDFFQSKFDADYLNCSSGILCNVSKHDSKNLSRILSIVPLMELKHSTKIPIQNAYESPQTLGLDRLASAVGAESISPRTNKIVIDMGTAITIDFIDDSATYVGGNISLGLQSRFRALHEFTGNLPLMQVSEQNTLIGKNTNQAICNGVFNSVLFELEAYIERFMTEYQNVDIFLTGGDSQFFEKRIKNHIFANRNLVAIGLHRILKYNEK